jgi:predicted ATP-grasp superfamily ATP-dependent carboligase
VKIFVYELVIAGGLPPSGAPIPESLYCEAAAMLSSLLADFGMLDGIEVCTMRHVRLGGVDISGCRIHDVVDSREEEATFRRLAGEADWTVVIAPEFDGLLRQRASWVEDAGGRLLGPSPNLIALAADKDRAARALRAADVPVPEGRLLRPGQPLPAGFSYPAVVKPNDGAGSLDMCLVRGPGGVLPPSPKARRLERYCCGTAASVAVLCGPTQRVPLAACRQQLSQDGQFRYLGGVVPLSAPMGPRAQRLALRAVHVLPDPLGYIGVDLVLGVGSDGADDVVIEINPRLTTSYMGLRAATDANLAAAMMTIAGGGRAVPSFHSQARHFTATPVRPRK